MRSLGALGALAIAVASPAIAAMPTPPATSAKLDQLATIVESMHGSSRTVDQRIADMLRPFAATEGVALPATASAYTEFPASAAKLRPKGWLIAITETNNGYVCAGLQKWTADGFLPASHEIGARSNVTGQTAGALALSAAMLRAWAQELREQGN